MDILFKDLGENLQMKIRSPVTPLKTFYRKFFRSKGFGEQGLSSAEAENTCLLSPVKFYRQWINISTFPEATHLGCTAKITKGGPPGERMH